MIRAMNRFDYDQIIEILVRFAGESQLTTNQAEPDRDRGREVLLRCQHGGVGLVAEQAGEIVGVLLAVKNPDIWFPRQIRLHELIWWVEPKLRGSTVAGRLLLKYKSIAEQMRQQQEITSYTIGATRTTRQIDLNRYGFEPFETIYAIGE